MTKSSFLGGERAARYASDKDVDAVGPSDTRDSGSDVQGERGMRSEGDHADELSSLGVDAASDSDSSGIGEPARSAGRDVPNGADIMPYQVIGPLGEVDEITDRSPVNGRLGKLAAESSLLASTPSYRQP